MSMSSSDGAAPNSVSVTVGGVTRELPSVRVGEMGRVPLIEFIGDSEFTRAVAGALLPLIPEGTQALMTVVTNSVPLAHEVSAQSGLPYVVARKKRRTYMHDPLIQEVGNLTLGVSETLWLDRRHAQKLRGQRVAVLTDVIASGSTVEALARLVERAGGTVVGFVAAFRQGNPGMNVAYLEELPTHL